MSFDIVSNEFWNHSRLKRLFIVAMSSYITIIVTEFCYVCHFEGGAEEWYTIITYMGMCLVTMYAPKIGPEAYELEQSNSCSSLSSDFTLGAVDVYNCIKVEVQRCIFENNGPADVIKAEMYRGHSAALSIGENPADWHRFTAEI